MPAIVVHRLYVPAIRRQFISANSAIGQVTPPAKPLDGTDQLGVPRRIDVGPAESLYLAPPGGRNQHVVA